MTKWHSCGTNIGTKEVATIILTSLAKKETLMIILYSKKSFRLAIMNNDW